ncbi:MAG: isoprenylcysteine carboxylmethyltransferase family protein [Alphaproteobacteria bacterium]|nr:isoprenylcysteine carboxylmethyltransferase family protein [Alphaproteobacteria bacterium]
MTDDPAPTDPAWLRLWLAIPDAVFRVAGLLFFLTFLLGRLPEYAAWPEVGPWWATAVGVDDDGRTVLGARQHVPLAKVLVDLTFLLVAVSFAVRLPPRARARHPREIVVPVLVAFWPLLPFLCRDVLTFVGSPWGASLDALLAYGPLERTDFLLGVGLVVAGNALDVWGYGTLLRSFSIVAEARELRTVGPYRWVRHPIYLGQIVAQGGIWLVLVEARAMWAPFYVAFVLMQLYRSRVEDGVLEAAFGEDWRAFARRSWWVFPVR